MTGKAAARIEAEAPDISDAVVTSWMSPDEGSSAIGPVDLELPVITLALEDLVRDANGEIVLFNDSNLRALAIESAAASIGSGIATRHVTAAGEDVSGFRYITFENGTTLFYQSDLDLVVRLSAG